jgi:hypothetical protein
MYAEFGLEDLNKKDSLEDLSLYGEDNIKMDLK